MRVIRRTCVGCRRAGTPDTLVRLVRGDHGELRDGTGAPGRGAWVCRADPGCFDRAARKGGFDRAFREAVAAGSIQEMRARLGTLLGWES